MAAAAVAAFLLLLLLPLPSSFLLSFFFFLQFNQLPRSKFWLSVLLLVPQIITSTTRLVSNLIVPNECSCWLFVRAKGVSYPYIRLVDCTALMACSPGQSNTYIRKPTNLWEKVRYLLFLFATQSIHDSHCFDVIRRCLGHRKCDKACSELTS